jgi:hypothetical protein
MFEKTGDRWEDKFEGLPGFSLVVAIVTIFLAQWSPRGGETAGYETTVLIAVAVGYLLYRAGSLLDKVFDAKMFYGGLEKAPHWPGGQTLHGARVKAANQLNCPLTGLYAKAEGLLKKSEEWQNEVKAKMDGSKAARSFIVPLLLILAAQAIKHFQLPLSHGLSVEWLEPKIEAFLVAAVLVYLITDIELFQWICFSVALTLLGILFLRLPGDWLNSWRFHPLTVGCALVLTTWIYVWQRVGAMTRLYELTAGFGFSKHFVTTESATSDEKVMKGMFLGPRTMMPLRVVALYPCKEQEVTEDELQRAERLVRSVALMHVQLYRFSERPPGAPLPEADEMLPFSLVLEEEKKKNLIGEYKTEDSKAGKSAKSDLVIKVVKDSAAKEGQRMTSSRGEQRRRLADLKKLINGKSEGTVHSGSMQR